MILEVYARKEKFQCRTLHRYKAHVWMQPMTYFHVEDQCQKYKKQFPNSKQLAFINSANLLSHPSSPSSTYSSSHPSLPSSSSPIECHLPHVTHRISPSPSVPRPVTQMDDQPPPHRTFTSRALPSRILSHMLDHPLLADLHVIISGKTFPCHRAVLSSLSPVFEAMFLSQMLESQSGKLHIPDITPDIFLPIRDYIYGKPLHIRHDLAIPISTFVRKFQIDVPELPDYMDKLLSSALTLDNVIPVRQHADAHSAHRLRRNCDRFITLRMKALANTESFLISPPSAAEATLNAPTQVSREALSRQSSQHVFSAAVAWLAHDEPARLSHLDTILNTIEVDALSLPALVRASRHVIAIQSPAFQARLLRAFARKAERDLGYTNLSRSNLGQRPAGFAIVDDSARDDIDVFPDVMGAALYPASLHSARRRNTFSASMVHHRFPSAPGGVGGRRIHFPDGTNNE